MHTEQARQHRGDFLYTVGRPCNPREFGYVSRFGDADGTEGLHAFRPDSSRALRGKSPCDYDRRDLLRAAEVVTDAYYWVSSIGPPHRAVNDHDPRAMIACLAQDYRSEQPLHPAAGFSGREQVATNWSLMFEEVPDLRIDVLRAAVTETEAWTELWVHGRKLDGTGFDYRGVTIWGEASDRITWARFYFEVVESDSPDIDARMRFVLGDRED